jgi:hypothetical protein
MLRFCKTAPLVPLFRRRLEKNAGRKTTAWLSEALVHLRSEAFVHIKCSLQTISTYKLKLYFAVNHRLHASHYRLHTSQPKSLARALNRSSSENRCSRFQAQSFRSCTSDVTKWRIWRRSVTWHPFRTCTSCGSTRTPVRSIRTTGCSSPVSFLTSLNSTTKVRKIVDEFQLLSSTERFVSHSKFAWIAIYAHSNGARTF